MRYRLWMFLLLALLTLLVGCNDQVVPKQKIDAQQVKSDLLNSDIPGPDGKPFRMSAGFVEVVNLSTGPEQAQAKVNIKAVSLDSTSGIEGTLHLIYQPTPERWQLQQIHPVELESLSPAYARRLTELVDFPLHFAANIGDKAGVEQALQQGAQVNQPEQKKASSALIFAAERGFVDIVKLLLSKGAEYNYQNNHDFSALQAASRNGHLEVVKLLVQVGADVDLMDESGRSALWFAADSDSLELLQYLVEQGADVNIRSSRNWTPLFSAVKNDSLEMTQYLIDQDAKVNIRSQQGVHSPLLMAANSGNVEMVTMLLEAGADPSARLSEHHSRNRNQTALDIAREKGHDAVVELLQNR
ncbi:MAG: ankyrin repeat domain-containing protein [Desulfuromonadales bacterium]|nr:ankyrin repeat domain-containing protein [Desulfuromonadales bacterium]